MNRMQRENGKPSVDFAIITIKEEEFEAVLDQFGALHEKPGRIRRNRDYIVVRVPTVQGTRPSREATVAVTRCGTQGNGVSQDVTRDIIADLSPSWILLVGIAGGLPASEFSLGDVVLNTTVLDFSVEAVKQSKDPSGETERTFALQEHRPHYQVENYVTTVAGHRHDLGEWSDLTITRGGTREALKAPPISLDLDNFYGGPPWEDDARESLKRHQGRPLSKPRVLGVPIGSSDRLIKDVEIIQIWLRVARQVRAIEMESAGVHIAARGRSQTRPSVPAMSIRGISDIVGYKRNEAWTIYACYSAAAFAHAFVRSGYVTQQTEAEAAANSAPEGPASLPPSHERPENIPPGTSDTDWGPAPEIVEAIRGTLQMRGQHVIAVFRRAWKAAEVAIQRATDANIAMTQARRLVAEKVPDDYSSIRDAPMIIRADSTAAGGEPGLRLGAVLWDSGDEYFGYITDGGATGVGVYKIYKIAKLLTPSRVAHYRGEMWRERYGTHGVFESAGSWVFAGEWIDDRPRQGCMMQSAEAEGEEYDLYIGEFGMREPLVWVPHGLGVSLRYQTNELTLGGFDYGKPGNVTRTQLVL